MSFYSWMNWIDTFPAEFFDKSFEEIFDDELRFIANDHAFSSESKDDIGLIVDAKGVHIGSDWLKKKRTMKGSVKIKFEEVCMKTMKGHIYKSNQ